MAGMDLHNFLWIYMDLGGISVILGLDAGMSCGSLWRAVAESCGPFILPYSVLGACRLAGWCLAGWLDGWMAGWKAPWMAGWLDGGHHSCNLARSSSRRVGGFLPDEEHKIPRIMWYEGVRIFRQIRMMAQMTPIIL